MDENPYQPPRLPVDRADGSLNHSRATLVRPRLAVTLLLIVSAIGLFAGVISRFVRPIIPGPIHYEAIVALGVLIVTIMSALWIVRRRPLWNALLNFNLVNVALWNSYIAGWSLIAQRLWNDMLLLMSAFEGSAALIGSLILLLLNRVSNRSHAADARSGSPV